MADSSTILVDCITLHHHYRGRLHKTGGRLSDALSNGQSDSVLLTDVRITAAGRSEPSVECSRITLQKENVLLAIPQEKDESPGQRFSRYQKKDRYGVVVALPGLLMSGIMHLPKTTGSWSLLRESGAVPRFLGLTEVTIHNAVFRLAPPSCPVAIVQRDAVEAIEVTASPLVEAAAAEVVAE